MAVNINTGANIEDSISTKELFREYDWYQKTFSNIVQFASDDFFTKNFKVDFIGLSKNINCLLKDESCFVTKIKINEEYDMFFRLTEKAIDVILEKVLGKPKSRFNINKISDLEAKIITAFNSYMFDALKTKMGEPDPKQLKRTNFDMVNLTFVLKDVDNVIKDAGKVIVTLPLGLLRPHQITSGGEKFANTDFPNSEIFVKVIMGKMKFPLIDIQNIEQDDVVVFENSNIEHMTLAIQDELLDIHLNPNMDLLIPEEFNERGENNMSANLWDNIEVEMNAEFDAVKITLGELKNIEDGLVVDLTSLYNNNVTLKVEGNPIASGTLVIVNDRYGVKINQVIAPPAPKSEQTEEEADTQEQIPVPVNTNIAQNDTEEQIVQNGGAEVEGDEEDFDYSDFDLDDEGL